MTGMTWEMQVVEGEGEGEAGRGRGRRRGKVRAKWIDARRG